MPQLEHIEAIEKRLWSAADTLRANSKFASNEYFLPVMGLIFLRHAYSRYLAVKDEIEAALPSRDGKTRPLTKEDFSQRSAIFLRPEAQFDYPVSLSDADDRARKVIEAMESIERDYSTLAGELPKSEYQELDNEVLGQLLRTLNPDELKRVSGDVFGRIYEYFLTQFADQKAHDGGEFFTPVSLVSLIAHVLDPERGIVLDPASGSGGMFVQSARVVAQHDANPAERLTFYGMEKNATTIRLAKMNLAVHGLEGKIQRAITYYEDPHELLATFAGAADAGHPGDGELEPARPEEELLADLAESIAFVRTFLRERGADLDAVIHSSGFARNAAIAAAKEAANENDETRKRFEIMCRAVFMKFKACINVKGINQYRADYGAIDIIYKSLQRDREQADISDIIRQLHAIVDEAITTRPVTGVMALQESGQYDISRIDFDRLRKEFERSDSKHTTVQTLKQAIEARLQRLLQQNPLRTDFQHHYEQIVADYNREKDRVTIEQTFEALMRFVQDLDEEEQRAVREGLDEETLAIFDLLKKPTLSPAESKRVKAIAGALLAALKAEKLRIDHWRDKEATRDGVRVAIHDFLYSDRTGLPVDLYTVADVEEKTDAVYAHVYRVYPVVPSPFYGAVA